MNLETFKQKVELMKDAIPYELYKELLEKEDLEECNRELSRYLHKHKEINASIDRLYSYVHTASMYRSNLTTHDRKKIKSYKGDRFTLS